MAGSPSSRHRSDTAVIVGSESARPLCPWRLGVEPLFERRTAAALTAPISRLRLRRVRMRASARFCIRAPLR